MRGPAGVSAVEECETKGGRSLTDGGIVPMTQFMEECCTERENKERERGGGGTYVFSRPCAEHMFAFDSGNTEAFSKQACRFRARPGLTLLGPLHNKRSTLLLAYTLLMPLYYYQKSVLFLWGCLSPLLVFFLSHISNPSPFSCGVIALPDNIDIKLKSHRLFKSK